MSNPVIRQYSSGYEGFPSVEQTSVAKATLDDVLMKTLMQFGLLVPIALIVGMFTPKQMLGTIAIGGFLVGLVLAFIIARKENPSQGLIFTYAGIEGAAVGAFSAMFEVLFPGIVLTAVIATTVTVIVIVAGQRAGILRTSPKSRKIFGYMLIGYIAFSLVALVAHLLGAPILVLGTPFAILVSLFGVGMAVFSLVTDIEDINKAIIRGLPESETWKLSFSLVVSLVWLYLEILRLIANIMANE